MYNVVIYDIEGGVHTLRGATEYGITESVWWVRFVGDERMFVIPIERIDHMNIYKEDEEDANAGSIYEKAVELADLAER